MPASSTEFTVQFCIPPTDNRREEDSMPSTTDSFTEETSWGSTLQVPDVATNQTMTIRRKAPFTPE